MNKLSISTDQEKLIKLLRNGFIKLTKNRETNIWALKFDPIISQQKLTNKNGEKVLASVSKFQDINQNINAENFPLFLKVIIGYEDINKPIKI